MAKKNIGRLGHYMIDPVFAEANRNVHAHFIKHLAAFAAFDANLNAAYAGNWLNQIVLFENHPTDESMVDSIEAATEVIAAQSKRCIKAVDDIAYYTKIAFPDNEELYREFGFQKTRSERDREILKMARNLFTMMRVANDYLLELTTAGMPATVMPNFNTQAQALGASEMDQEYVKRLRIRQLRTRVSLYNALYKTYDRVRAAAKAIYRTDPETLQLFEIFRGEG